MVFKTFEVISNSYILLVLAFQKNTHNNHLIDTAEEMNLFCDLYGSSEYFTYTTFIMGAPLKPRFNCY